MARDPIMEEVRAIREQLAAQFGFDIRAIVEDARKRQEASQALVVSFETPSQLQQPSGAPIAGSESPNFAGAAPAAHQQVSAM